MALARVYIGNYLCGYIPEFPPSTIEVSCPDFILGYKVNILPRRCVYGYVTPFLCEKNSPSNYQYDLKLEEVTVYGKRIDEGGPFTKDLQVEAIS